MSRRNPRRPSVADPAQSDNLSTSRSSTTEEDVDKPSPIVEHLMELRTRIIYSIVFLVLGCILGFILTGKFLLHWIFSPILAIPDARLQVLGPAEKIGAYFKVSFIAGLVISLPFIAHQAWLFLRPGLKKHERRFLTLLVPSATALFLLGAAFVFYVMIPAALPFLLQQIDLGIEVEANITLDRYFSFVLALVLAGGLVFQIPLVTYFLARAGLVSGPMLAKQRKLAVLGTVLLAAILTPTGDPFNLVLLALPIYLLYEISILVASAAYHKAADTGQAC